jgi:putative oxidoreductase
MSKGMTPVRTAARTMLAGIFVAGGLDAIRDPGRVAPAAKPVTEKVTPAMQTVHPKAPTDTETLVRLNGAAQVAGGLLLATGHATRPAAVMLAASLVPTTLAGHRFWDIKDPEQRKQQQVHFLKNLGLFGGLLLAAVDTEGRPSLGWRARDLARRAQDRVTGS